MKNSRELITAHHGITNVSETQAETNGDSQDEALTLDIQLFETPLEAPMMDSLMSVWRSSEYTHCAQSELLHGVSSDPQESVCQG